jgi:hypothetical protein
VQKNVDRRKKGNFGRRGFRAPEHRSRLATSGLLLAASGSLSVGLCSPSLSNSFSIFVFFIFGSLGMGLGFWESRCIAPPIFEPCPYTWEGEIFHFSWNLKISFFSNFLLKLDHIKTFIAIVGIFV